MKRWTSVLGSVFLGALFVWNVFVHADSVSAAQGADQSANYTVKTLALPDGNLGDVSMDYIVYDASTNSVWVPGGNTGAVDVVDAATGKVRQVTGFPTKEVEVGGSKRLVGPSGVSIGVGVAYIGSRGDSSICAVNLRTLVKGTCGHIDNTPDAVVYVATTKEVWVTVPADKTIRILDGKTLEQKGKMTFEGAPEGYSVDVKNGRFYTNLEDKDRTLAIDPKTQKIVTNWDTGCGKDGPRGLIADPIGKRVYVACVATTRVLDMANDGKLLSSIDSGDGVDDMSYSSTTHLLYIAASRSSKLTIARVDDKGQLSVVATVPTKDGIRNAVVTKDGTVYMAHSRFANIAGLLVATPAKK